ncbi:MAG: MGMT family protein [Candidatus Cloacimonetes bacterium]|nr:MGMT family protein [Candidatus Cloacimonadota bacterium]
MSSYEIIYAVVRRIPRGKVSTYGRIAEIAGLPGQARLVGYALHNLKEGTDVPWQRVINARGEISDYGDMEWVEFHRSLLESEGIEFIRGRKVDLKKYLWQG